MKNIMWIAGVLIEWPTFEILGVYSTEEKAVKACYKNECFVMPIETDVYNHPDDSTIGTVVDGCYYPLMEDRPE